ncbi:hypothetical protein PCASD_14783 [Puccinia coronata f. sp. avenae]|uniref:Flavin reductase like domain-containing protein n=1 Tax=Puccinia coronata f. sp. avenae TaxID=200324 RepID=A0A2N5SGM9_9BASI|nr:hypothetical protein PCASD_14783 [Puccinia coronata f. sp. avenae]
MLCRSLNHNLRRIHSATTTADRIRRTPRRHALQLLSIRGISTRKTAGRDGAVEKLSTSSDHSSTPSPAASAQDAFRQLMRQLSYPVTILTVQLHNGDQHGATLSSLSSIALEPKPMVSLSLRHPSRLATYLLRQPHVPFTVYLLNHHPQSIQLATLFSQPRSQIPHAAFASLQRSSFASLHCQVIKSFNLSDLHPHFNSTSNLDSCCEHNLTGSSTLFIAQVLQSTPLTANTLQQQPLMYHNRSYTTIKPQG